MREAFSVLLLASFVGAQPVGGVEQEHDAEFPEDFEVLSMRGAMGSPLLLGLFTSGLIDLFCCSRHTERGH